jgi:hypothetical protein
MYKVLQNLRKLVFLVWKYAIWQPRPAPTGTVIYVPRYLLVRFIGRRIIPIANEKCLLTLTLFE